MSDIAILKTIPASNPEYRIEVQHTTYPDERMKDSWSISVVLLSNNPENKYGIYSVGIKSGYDKEFPTHRPSEEQAIAMAEEYLTKINIKFEDAVKKMVDRWAVKSFESFFNQNNGDTGPNGGMAFAFMNLLSARAQEKVTPDKVQIWKDTLTKAMIEGGVRNLYTDYHPDKILDDACQAAGISTDCIPIKSCGNIDRITNVCRVSFGYHGKEEIF